MQYVVDAWLGRTFGERPKTVTFLNEMIVATNDERQQHFVLKQSIF